ncbi:Zn-ribbon domain-containing OB-fold protein [Nocardia stercoris]|uniref:Uncharacterized protein n=1 Tax=Nocardia stercoris TaxID=2483361 RepID=A0A3M2KX56_9NOCA|nr:OB-fold domain-containing protein [Nocardia stercoris]RMI30122.1 hypothetical protein EBN03_23135 [Nocardia stercoris]
MAEQIYESGPTAAGTGLMIRRCSLCGKLLAPLIGECSKCGSRKLDWMPASGLGSIVSWRSADRCMGDIHSSMTPLTIAIVELDEGPWLYATVDGDVPPLSDRPIRVRFEPRPPLDRFPVFVVCGAQIPSAALGSSAARESADAWELSA